MADLYPNSTFDGMDLSPIQPDWVPQNVSFMVDDIEHEAGWTYGENELDYIHVRHLIHSIKDRREMWRRIYRYFQHPAMLLLCYKLLRKACMANSMSTVTSNQVDMLRYRNSSTPLLATTILAMVPMHGETF